ncbi:zinc finger SWIM domain protein [Hymenobacter roseosalivarius DSM 11622]|uniref:Zinc finger SWIM domain protein n=1 Tax=Hymenobacter roseosalivarius DSM 11622 TaxID=645990 RepID=A0A1W1V362_9BACT|nr:hypothetical protein [Hymenobacter roseosalivarius]SMB87723.1 zinc finger SWIM domain protein [Hymenobacter roseosalivarius DSM 11622]
MFTLFDLRVLANAASFSRGRAYFEEGAVGRVRHQADDNLFSATVSGSDDYTVELTLTPDGPDFFCDCPYDYDGICKHCVALGLTVLEEFGLEAEARNPALKPKKGSAGSQKTVAPLPAKPALAEAAPPVSAAALEAALREVGKPEKLKFLELQLRQNPSLAQAFLIHFYGPPLPPDPLDADTTLPRPDDLRDELRRALGRLRFDYDYLADDDGNLPPVVTIYGQASRFLPALTERIGAVLEPVLLPVAAAIRAALEAGRLAEAVRRWHGAWLGITGVKRPAADAYYLFSGGQYARQVVETWLRLLPEVGVEKLLSRQEFAPQEVARCVPVLIRPVLREAHSVRPQPSPPTSLAQVPDADQVLLLAVAFNPSLAPALRAALQPHEDRLPVLLRLRLATGCRDWASWEPLTAQEAAHNPGIALSLLQFYLDHDRRADLLRAADTYFTPTPS